MTQGHGPAIAAVLLAGLVAACMAPAADAPSSSPVAATGPPATGAAAPSVRPLPVPTATAPSAPAPTPMAAGSPSATPSPVATGDLLVRLDVCADVCIDPRREEYLADGRVIHLEPQSGQLVERRLSPAGLALVRSRLIADADLLGRDLNVFPEPVPGKTPPGHGVESFAFLVPGEADGRVTVRTVTAPSLDPGYWQTDPRIDRLTALGDALLDPEKLAGSDGWADAAWTAYEPSKTAVFVHVRDGAAPFSSPDLGAAGWPLGDDPRTLGEPFASTMDAWPIARCAVMDAATASEAAVALPAGVLDPQDPAAFWRMGTMAWAERGLELDVAFRTLLPDQESQSCADLWLLE